MFQDKENFPFVSTIEKEYPTISGEFNQFYSDYPDCFLLWIAKDEHGFNKWNLNVLNFSFCGYHFKEVEAHFPETVGLLESLPVDIPTAFFSRLLPHKKVKPHVGWESNVLRASMGINVPKNTCLEVGGDQREFKEGICRVFDDTTLHSAENNSDEERIVFIFDFMKQGKQFIQPMKDKTMRQFIRIYEKKWHRILNKPVLLNAS